MENFEHAFFYQSENHDRVYGANSFEYWLKKFFTTGVFNGDLQVNEKEGMTVTIAPGYINIGGKVKFYEQQQDLMLETAHATYDRIDSIVIERNDSDRDFFLKIVTGGYSTDPVPAIPVRENGVDQRVLAQIRVNHGAVQITQADITDTRADPELCGIVAGTVKEIDFSQFTAQFDAFFAEYRESIVEKFEEFLENADNYSKQFLEWVVAKKAEITTWQGKEETETDAWQKAFIEELESWAHGKMEVWTNEILDWFQNVRDQLTDDPAMKLQEQIGNLNDLNTTAKNNLTAAVNEVKAASGVTGVKGNNESTYSKGNVNITPDKIGAVNKTGDTMTGTLNSSKSTGSYLAGNKGQAIINSTAAAGAYTMLDKLNSTNGYFTDGVFQGKRLVQYTAKTTVDKGTNSPTKSLTLLDEAGNSNFPGTVTALAFNGNATSATKTTQDSEGKVIKDTYAKKDAVLKLVETGEFTNDTITIPLRHDAAYLLFTREIKKSTGEVYGHRARLYNTPEANTTGKVIAGGNMYVSTNAGVTLGISRYRNDSAYMDEPYGITLKASATYRVSYSLYEMANSYGNYEYSDIEGGEFGPHI